jgi:CheY-like chemotaxis protein
MLVPQPVSILLVDDHARNLVALEAALAGVDCRLVKSRSGREALRCLLTQDFAVILIDIHMPEMDGFETASLIRARKRSHSTPIIFLTADDRAEARLLDDYQLGAADYIHKSLDQDMLRAQVSSFVDLFRKTAALEQRTAELSTMAAQLERSEAQVRTLKAKLERDA